MQKIKYPKFINIKDIEKIEDVENQRLFKLTLPLKNSGKKRVLVITRAPKISEYNGENSMTIRIIKYIKRNMDEYFKDIGFIDIVFLFPIIEFEYSTLETVLAMEGEMFTVGNNGFCHNHNIIKNDEIIFQSMIESNYIVLAWGEAPRGIKSIYDERIKYLLKGYKLIKINTEDIKDLYVVGALTTYGYPKHCLAWRESDELVSFDI
ncbi:DUF1643 domain-containing protein [Clostridium sp.]|uniref:DUF1643 domain-containing protein n=1 Tax=Clostridium sp. TaxID=1506 RepID=UPI00399474B3